MDNIPRLLEQKIMESLKPQKAALIFGARRTGKTVIMRQIIKQWKSQVLFLNGDDYDAQKLLENRSIANYRRLLNGINLLAIDEAQNIPDIGLKIKLILDEIPSVCVLASGSSSFDLQNQTGEPLVGRSKIFRLAPFSQKEISAMETALETRQNLEERLVYGAYPEVVIMKNLNEKADYLREIVQAYLLRDILSIDGLKNASKIRDLLRLIAFQLGNEVSLDELGKQLGMSKNTVEKYLDLLSKSFVLFRLGAYSRNLRKEIVKAGKWYFYDTGIRNALIGNFKSVLKTDIGALWESYIVAERLKDCWNSCFAKNFYFWRTYDKQEIDLLEESGESGEIRAFEIKWKPQKSKLPIAFANAYKQIEFNEINKENYLEFV
ncbi:MAG: ATP-binding protein [Fibromonadaceae bacterium]|jgi:predicted AAA+ superfamily ATPase|nr:ATP-binding protein [Fibromonadaceae bacterium]